MIRALRHRRGLTLQALADQLGVVPSYVSHLEHGRRSPSTEVLHRLAKVMELTDEERLALFDSFAPPTSPPPGDCRAA